MLGDSSEMHWENTQLENTVEALYDSNCRTMGAPQGGLEPARSLVLERIYMYLEGILW